MLRFYDPAAREWLPDPEQAMVERKLFERRAIEAERRQREAEGRRREAEARAAAEAQSRQAAEAELAKLKTELEKLRGKEQTNS
jgi:hypothetical protein